MAAENRPSFAERLRLIQEEQSKHTTKKRPATVTRLNVPENSPEDGEQPSNPKGQSDKSEEEKATLACIEELNKKHFVSQEGGKTFVFTEEWDESMGRNVLQRSRFPDFINFYLNRFVYAGESKAGDPIRKPVGEVWVKHRDRRQYEGITMEPGKETPGIYNLWRGFSVEPKPGTWSRMHDHIFEIICCGDSAVFQYVMGWLATAIQKPGKRAEVAIVFRGKRGTGKGMVGNYMCKLFGANAAHITSAKHLTGNFNSHLRDVIFLFADEAFWAGDKQGESVLKGLITEPNLTIEGKGRDVVFVKNRLHILLASNNDWVIPAGLEERRFCVLNVSDKRIQDKKYFGTLVDEMENGGLSAMFYALQNYDLSNFEIRDVPQTAGLFEQKLQTLDDFHQWWFHRLCEGEIIPGKGWCAVPCAQLYNAYVENLSARAIHRRAGETIFGLSLKKVLPPCWPRKHYRQVEADYPAVCGGERCNHYEFPALEICREYFETLVRAKIDWDV